MKLFGESAVKDIIGVYENKEEVITKEELVMINVSDESDH